MSYIHLNGKFEDFTADTIEPYEILTTFNLRELRHISKRLDVPFNREQTEEQLAANILVHVSNHPENLLCLIPPSEYPALIELFEAEPTKYIERRYRCTSYFVMRMGMVPAFEDDYRRVWSMIMPTKIKDIIGEDLPFFVELYKEKKPFPTPEEFRQIRKAKKTSQE